MNWQQVRSNWTSVRTKAHVKWDKLTDDDLQAIDGRRDQLVKLLEQRYKMDHKKAETEAESFAKTIN